VQNLSAGDPIRLTSGISGGSPAWTRDGRELVFDSAMGGLETLWRISATGGTPRPLAGGGEGAHFPSISRSGDQLAYQRVMRSDDIWRIDLKDEKHARGSPARMLAARGFIRRPHV